MVVVYIIDYRPKIKLRYILTFESEGTWRLFQQGNLTRAYGSCHSACREDGIYLYRCNKRRYVSCPKCFLPFLKPVLYSRIKYYILKLLSIQKY